jgi:hypothetical protein
VAHGRRRFSIRAVVLVEGISDQRALEALAERRGRDLDVEGVSVVAMGGAQAIGRFLELCGPRGFVRPELEAELIRALGTEAVEAIVDAQGHAGSFRTLQKQPAWQNGQPTNSSGASWAATAGRPATRALVAALPLTNVPRPLEGVLAHVRRGGRPAGRGCSRGSTPLSSST